MTTETRILFVDDEPAYCRIFRNRFRRNQRFVVETATSGKDALTRLQDFSADIVFTDLNMPFMDGIELVAEIRSRFPHIFVLILTGIDSTSKAVQAMKAGAYDYLLKPLDFDMVERAIETILAHKSASQSQPPSDQDRQEDFRFENIIGQDRKMYEIYEKINQVARTSATVLITGESGTGKELIAAAIHARSARLEGPFIQVNCAALTEGLVNSELFGHEKGAFTGAVARKRGFFEQASGGTLFLDEIGDISVATQVALLRILELGTLRRVGGTETISVDVRLITATNRDLASAVREKLFREDLFYRINVVSLQAPPLRDRKSDIPLLARFFLERYRASNGKRIDRITREAMELLCSYDWPGNCRELANIIEQAVVFCCDQMLTPESFPVAIRQPVTPHSGRTLNLKSTSLAEVETILIRQVLEEKDWNLKQTAEALDIARGTLYSKMEKLHISKPA